MNQIYKNFTIFVLIIFILFILLSNWSAGLISPMIEGMAPYVETNTLVETNRDHLDKRTYMMDTCGNYLKSHYQSMIHSVPKSVSSWWNQKTKTNVTAESCKNYQQFVSDADASSGYCTSICTNSHQYYDLTKKDCEYCPIGYSVQSGSNQCTPLETCPSDKKYVDNTDVCKPCPVGKKYDDGINCTDICLDYQTMNLDNVSCSLKCPLRNQQWDPIHHQCINCPTGYVADGHNNCVPAPTCSPGLILDSNNNCVAKCTSDWEHYNASTNTCVQTCLSTQHFVNGSCTDCPNNGTNDGQNHCLPVPTTPPPSCQPGYTLVNGKCESYCPVWEKNNLINPTMCNPICYRNTQYFDANTYNCKECPQGQIGDGNNGCMLIPTPAPTPLVCTDGYALNSTQTVCNSICPPWRKNNNTNPSQCDLKCTMSTQYYDLTQFTCLDCPNGGVADNNNQCVVPPTPAPTTPAPTTAITITTPPAKTGLYAPEIFLDFEVVGRSVFTNSGTDQSVFIQPNGSIPSVSVPVTGGNGVWLTGISQGYILFDYKINQSFTYAVWVYVLFWGGNDENNLINTNEPWIEILPSSNIGNSLTNAFVDNTVPLNWYHHAVVIDHASTSINIYKNGNVIATNNQYNSPFNSHEDVTFYLGRGLRPGAHGIYIDQFRFYNHALSSSEIKQIYNMASTT